jgi:two-component system, OmpR family, phosphate regulon sensor histidine kinase PhoR
VDPVVLLLAAIALTAGTLAGIALERARTRRRGIAATSTRAAPAAAGPRAPADPAHRVRDAESRGAPRDAVELLEQAGFGVLSVDAGLTVVAASEVATRLLARRPGTVGGRSVMEAFTDHHVEAALRAAFETGGAEGETTLRGRTPGVLLYRARRIDRDHLTVVLQDVSELRRLQRIRTEFVDNISHELRTPITTVSLLAETLSLEGARLPPKTADRIEKIRVETDHLVTMVNELLDLSRIESGAGRLVIDEVDPEALARATTERIAHFAERSGVGLEVVVPAGVPAIRGDGERLGQALLNLIHNAVKFSPPGTTVTIRVTPGESEVTIAVEDHGPGIPRAALERVFERFYKVDRARTRSGGGTGLGLSIAKHVVEAHGGRIWASSVEGEGSTFAFSIPLRGPELGASAGG